MKSLLSENMNRSSVAGLFRRYVCLLVIALLCCVALSCAAGEDSFTATEGDSSLRVTLPSLLQDVSVNLFSGEESLLDSVEQEDSDLRLTLTRPLRASENLLLLLSGTDAEKQAVETSMTCSVASLFEGKLSALTRRATEFRSSWVDTWLPLVQQEKIDIPFVWRNLPFALWPDEAPEIRVLSSGASSVIYLSEPVPEDWRICTGKDIPVVYSPCDYDAALGAWVTQEPFESVFLIHDMTADSASLTIEYKSADSFRASYPVVEYVREQDGTASGFNSYGWGTSRSFDGGMFAIVAGETIVYAEYGPDQGGSLVNYFLPVIDCSFDPEGNLLSGAIPEDFINPVKTY